MVDSFRYGHASAPQWAEAAQSCLSQLGQLPLSAKLGFLYVTDLYANSIPDILDFLKRRTEVSHWVGTVGVGICSAGREYLNKPAMAVMVASLPQDSFRVFSDAGSLSEASVGNLLAEDGKPAYFAVVHGDPHTARITEVIEQLAGEMQSGFLVGGLSSSRAQSVQIADEVIQGGLSGVMFSSDVSVSTRLTQGCSPIGPRHRITQCQRNIIISLDGRPALEVFYEVIGEILARDLNKVTGYIFAGLPIEGSDTGDYLVRNLMAIDPNNKVIAISELLRPDMPLMFCRRDAASAHDDMLRMLKDISHDLKAPPKGGVYYSCLGRGENLFGANSKELQLIEETLGDFPLVGFFANGEISHNRLYGYTGVLTLFT